MAFPFYLPIFLALIHWWLLYICVYTHIYTYIHTHTYIHIHTHIYIYTHMYIYTHIYIYIHIHFVNIFIQVYLIWASQWASRFGLSGKESTCQCRRCRRCRFNLWVEKISWRRKWEPTPVFLPGESEKPGGQQTTVSQRVWHFWATEYAYILIYNVLIFAI